MRIDGSYRPAISTRTAARTASGTPAFHLEAEASTPRPAAIANTEPMTPLDALLALQAVEDPLLARRRTIRRGRALIDVLEAVRLDLLVGRVAEGRLNQLVVLVGQVPERTDARLDSLLAEIELRARVELAKFGRFPR